MDAPVQVLSIDELNKLTRKPKLEHGGRESCQTLAGVQYLWKRLLHTAHHPTVSDKHTTAACNAVCYVVRTSSYSLDKDVQTFAFSRDTWNDAFVVSHSAFASGKNKPALQVLDTLVYLAESNPNPGLVKDGVLQAATEMVRTVFYQQPKKALKEACIVLYFFLRKLSDFMSFSDVLQKAFSDAKLAFLRRCRAAKLFPNTFDDEADQHWFSFILSLLMIVNVAESKSATLKLLSLICSLRNSQIPGNIIKIVSQALDCYGSANESALSDVTRDVLPSVLVNKEQFHTFLSEARPVELKDESALQLVLAQLKLGRSKGYIEESDLPRYINDVCRGSNKFVQSNTVDTYDGFRILLSNGWPAIRQTSLDLLTFSASPKTPLPCSMLDCMVISLNYLHEDTDAYFRGELISTFRRFLTRLRQCRFSPVSPNSTANNAGAEAIDHFLGTYLSFLKAELAPHLSYGRHTLALEVLFMVLENFGSDSVVSHCITSASTDIQQLLFRLLLDPYDDIRSTSVKVLSCTAITKYPSTLFNFELSVHRAKPLDSICTLASATNRADHADALGRIICLLSLTQGPAINASNANREKGEIQMLAERLCAYIDALDEFEVSAKYPLHGNILGMAYILKSLPRVFIPADASGLKKLLLSICSRIWLLSQPHLCVDSPELETETTEEISTSGPKDVLAYAWRALRDSNLLMQAMLEAFDSSYSLIASIGELCFSQLRRLRHRGAFSTVAQTFLQCCQKARSASHDDLIQLPVNWFREALIELERQADKLTRRSAGLPAMFAALLDPSDNGGFCVSFQRLVDIAVEEPPHLHTASSQANLRLPQVHALNCIKDVMTNSRFRNSTETLVVLTINIAAKCMSSSVWAIKNCGLMLLRASINRLDPDTGLGMSEGGYSMRSSLPNLGTPIDIGMMLLEKSSAGSTESPTLGGVVSDDEVYMPSNAEAEFAALDLIGRLYIKEHENSIVKEKVVRKLSHRIWHVRTQAARLLTQMTAPGDEMAFIRTMIDGINEKSSDNDCHGRLSTMLFVIQGMEDNVDPQEYSASVAEMLMNLVSSSVILEKGASLTICCEIVSQIFDLPVTDSVNMMGLVSAWRKSLDTLPRIGNQLQALSDRARGIFLLQSLSLDVPTSINQVASILLKDRDLAVDTLTQFQKRHRRDVGISTLASIINVVCNAVTEDLKATAIDAIVCIACHKNLEIRKDDITALTNTLRFDYSICRQLMISQLKLFTWLCAQSWLLEENELLLQLKRSGNAFCLHLRAAASDEYEEPTRKGAAEALLLWTELVQLENMMHNIFGSSGQLEIVGVLHDLLNDDDEEIRRLSTQIATRLCNPHSRTIGVLENLSAAASRERLRKYLLQHSSNSEDLLFECLRRLFGLGMTVSMSRLRALVTCHVESTSVREEIDNIMAASTDLFAEEKQNLYIDDVAEVRDWAQLMCTTQVEIAPRVRNKIEIWATQGLESLLQLLSNSEGNIVVGYSVDLDVLVIRVVTVARVIGVYNEVVQDLHQKCKDVNMSAVERWSCGHTFSVYIVASLQMRHFPRPHRRAQTSENFKFNYQIEISLDLDTKKTPKSSIQYSEMTNFNVKLFLCFLFVTPVVVFIAWKMWISFILEQDLRQIDEGLRRQEAGQNPVVAPPPPAPA